MTTRYIRQILCCCLLIAPGVLWAQRHIGCTYGLDQFNRSRYFSSNASTEVRGRVANEWGLYLLRYTSDKRFIETSARNANSSSTGQALGYLGQYVVNGRIEEVYQPANTRSILRYSSFDIRFGKIWGKREMDDDFFLFHTAGGGLSRIKQFTDYQFNSYALGAEVQNYEFTQWGLFVTASLGAQLHIYDSFCFRSELSYMLGSNNQGFIPRFSFLYRLY